LGEFGLVIPQGIINVAKRVPEILEDASNELPMPFRHLIDRLTKHLKELDRQVKEFERQIIAWHRSSELSRKLEKIPGIGPLAASALVASIADAHSFDNGRQVSVGFPRNSGPQPGPIMRPLRASTQTDLASGSRCSSVTGRGYKTSLRK
jgi:transposase